jgi:hypothetical protein
MSPAKRSSGHQASASTTLAQTRPKSKKGRRGKAKELALSPQEMFDGRKEGLTQEKEAEMVAITQRHDGLVNPPSLCIVLEFG